MGFTGGSPPPNPEVMKESKRIRQLTTRQYELATGRRCANCKRLVPEECTCNGK